MSRYPANIITKSPATPTGPTSTGRAPGIWRMDDVAYWIKQGVWPNANIVPDQYFPYVSLLLSTTSLGNANNNLFVDSSGAFNPISRNGTPTQGSFTPYSTNWSYYFNGSSTITFPQQTLNGDFTIEAWVYYNENSTQPTLIGRNGGSPLANDQALRRILVSGNGRHYFYDYATGFSLTGSINILPFTWTHLAVTRSGTTTRIFTNGVLDNSGTWSGSFDYFCVGGVDTSNDRLNGYASNVRVVDGTAVYTSNFTPPTTPLTAIAGTELLICQSNRFRDAGPNNLTLTINGSPAVSKFSPYSPADPGAVYNQSDITNWSGYFDGTGDYGRITGSQTALQFGTGDFTLEGWVYSTGATGTYQQILTGGTSWTSGSGGVYWYYNSGSPYIGAAWNQIATNPAVNSSTLAINTWHHFAVVRSGNTLSLYVNGTSVDTLDVTGVSIAVNNQSQTNIGGGGWDQDFGGYLSNLRVVKGTAVYTSNFTPPTTNLTAISGTSLLTLQNAAFTDNSTNNFVITQFGNTTVTGNSPFNTVGFWSNYFDGSSYLTVANNTALNVWDNGSGSFTVEAWIYATASIPNNTSIIAKATNDGNPGWANGWAFQVFNGYLNVNTPGDNRLFNSNTTSVPLNQWVHCALVKSGSTVSIYQNGTRVGTTTNSNTYSNTTDAVAIGVDRNLSGGGKLTGYVSNARMVKGTAVYDPTQSTLTVPTAPLTAVSGTSLLTCQNGRFIDNSTNAFTITLTGSPQAQSFDPFYTSTVASNGGSLYFGSNATYLRSPSVPSLGLGTSAFTFECWVYPNTYPNDSYLISVIGNNSYSMSLQIRNAQVAAHLYTGSHSDVQFTDTAPVLNAWNHIAISRVGNTLYGFINGVRSSVTASVTASFGTTGYLDFCNSAYRGFITDARVTTGSAVYSSATYTVPTAPLTPTSATGLLLNGMNAGIYDATIINDMATFGNAQVTTAVSKFGGSSVYFDGSGDYLETKDSPQFAFGTGDFTIEGWFYTNTTSGDRNLVDFRPTSTNGAYPNVFIASGGYLSYNANGIVPITGGTVIATGTWYHFALTRSGTSTKLFLNGVQQGSTYTDTTNYLVGTNRPRIAVAGYGTSVANFNGYLDDIRITTGVARYTSNFTPPTQAFPTY